MNEHEVAIANTDLAELRACVEIRTRSGSAYVGATAQDIEVWKGWADDAARLAAPASAMRGAAMYAKERFGAEISFEDKPGGKPRHRAAILLIDATAATSAKGVDGFARRLMEEAGFWVSENVRKLSNPPYAAQEVLRGLAATPMERVKSLAKLGQAVHELFEQSKEKPGRGRPGRDNKYLVGRIASLGGQAEWLDFAGRREANKPYQALADLVALGMLGQNDYDDGRWSVRGGSGDNYSREQFFNRAALLLASGPPMRELPRFDGLEPYPELDYRAKTYGGWAKPKLAGRDLFDVLVSPELIEGYGHVDPNDHADLVERALAEVELAPGRAAKALRRILVDGDHVANRGHCFGDKRLAGVAKAIAQADASFDLADVGLEEETGWSHGTFAEALREYHPATLAILELASERAGIARAAGPGNGAPARRLRL